VVHSKHKTLAILGLLSAATTWGLIWYPYRVLEQVGISGSLSSFVTYAVALVLGVAVFSRQLVRLRQWGWILLGIALAAGWTNLAYVLAVVHGEIMRVLLLFYLAPLWTILLSRLLLGEKLDHFGYLVMFLSLGGAVIMLWRPEFGLPLPQNTAEWMGLSAGMMFATTNVLTRRAQGFPIWLKSMVVWAGVAFLSAGPSFAQPSHLQALFSLPLGYWLLMIGIGVVLFLVTLSVQFGLTNTSANQAIVIFLFELVVAAISSYVLAREAMSLQEWIGGGMIILASLFSGKLEHHHGQDH
jgi:drug/metabolite transporter (DMT)-like permease